LVPLFSKNQGSLRTRIIQGAFGSLILKVSATGMTMAVAIVLARWLGARGFGIYAFSLSVAQLLTVPAMLGLPQLMVREVSACKTKGAFSLMRGLLTRAWQNVLAASIVLVGLAGGIAYVVAERIDAMVLSVFWPALLLVPLTAMIQVYDGALRGLGRIVLGQLPRMLIKNGLFIIFLVAFFLFLPARVNAHAAIVLQVAATLAAAVLIWIFLKRALPGEVQQSAPQYNTRAWMKSACPMLAAGGMYILNQEISLIMLGIFGKAEDAGFFRVAQRGAELIAFGLLAVSMAIGPTISTLFVNGRMDQLQTVLTKSARAILAFALPVALILMTSAKWLVPFVFGAEFKMAAMPLIILCAGQLVNAAMGPVGLVLTMTRNEHLTAAGVAIAAFVNLVLCAVLVPFLGAIGAAAATSLAMVIWNILLAVWLFKRLGLTAGALGTA